MAYLQARSGIARSGVTYCGWTPPSITCYVGGVDRTANTLHGGWTLTTRSDGTPSTLAFVAKGFTPALGADVKICYATPDDYWFGGTLAQMTALVQSDTRVWWQCTAVGYQWLLNRYDPVLAQYASTSAGTIIADLLYRFTDGGFKVGYCPSSLGNLTIQFTYEQAWDAIVRVAKAVGATPRIRPERRIDVYVTYPETAPATVTEDSFLLDSFAYAKDLTQVRTRVLYEGRGTVASSAVAAGATTVPVSDIGMFPDSGSAVSGRSQFTYSGRSAMSGAGSLTGCSGVLYDIAADDEVKLVVVSTDAAATTALATLLGGGLSGQATAHVQDGRLSSSEATARASAELATFGGALEEAGFTYVNHVRHARAGMPVTLAVATPVAVAGTFTLQALTITPRGEIGGAQADVAMHAELGKFTRSLTEILRQLR